MCRTRTEMERGGDRGRGEVEAVKWKETGRERDGRRGGRSCIGLTEVFSFNGLFPLPPLFVP